MPDSNRTHSMEAKIGFYLNRMAILYHSIYRTILELQNYSDGKQIGVAST